MIQKTELDYSYVKEFSSRDIEYQTKPQRFNNFISGQVQLTAFSEIIKAKSLQKIDRKTLVATLFEQYSQLNIHEKVNSNIDVLLKENGYCVTTAHQPSLMTGPLYYIYKIISTISLSRSLQSAYPAYNIVPVFVSGGEDHDFEEVQHFNLFGKTYTWESEQKGSVGRFQIQELKALFEELSVVFGTSKFALDLAQKIEDAFTVSTSYGDFVFRLVNSLFERFGLVIVNTDNPAFKKQMAPIFLEELTNNTSKKLVEESQHELAEMGYKPKAYARFINLFYLSEGSRERIEFENDKFVVLNSELKFSLEEIKNELKNHPENFSPNVILRPLFQETILPNLAYVGGGGEIAYWLERKRQFDHYGVPFPVLMRRNSVLWIDKRSRKILESMGFSLEDVFLEEDHLINKYVESHSNSELSLDSELKRISEVLEQISLKTKEVDPTLAKSFRAENVKILKSVSQMESRLRRAEKQKHEISLNKLRKLKKKLFPGSSLQERKDNFIPYYLKYGPEYLDILLTHLDPLNKKFVILSED
jgi:bacillithiol biosynthesis cysteine-adding enzyme BshC